MFIQILLAILIGISAGIFTGLIPGIHINLVSLILVSLSPLFLNTFQPIILGIFIIAMALTHTFIDAIPGIYLGAPDSDQALNALPGHRFLLKGRGHEALIYTVIGSLFCILLAIFLFPLFAVSMKMIYPIFKNYTGYALIAIMSYMILKESTIKKKLLALTIFLTAGTLGLITLNLTRLNQPLFHLLSGLFGFSILILSITENTKIPKQKQTKININAKNLAKSTTASTFIGFIAAFLPGFGSSQAAIIATNIVGDIGDEGFLALVGGINTVNMLVSIATAYTLQKARNGAIISITKIIGNITLKQTIIFIITALIVAGIASILALKISKIFSILIQKVNYKKLIISILFFITSLSLLFDGLLGITILITATALGITASKLNIGKNHLMGCLIIPVILFFIL